MGLTFGSLFSGIGGFDLGFERAGMQQRYMVEFDKYAQGVLRTHFPGTPLMGDVRDVGAGTLPNVDVLCGGFPCQDLSVAGRRAGLTGARSGLFYEFARIIDETQPSWVVIENVPGLLSSGGGRDMGVVLGTLSELGYGWAYRVLDAQYFGVPQRRRRVFIVGRSGGRARDCASVLFEPESVLGNPPPSRETGQDAAACLRGRSSSPGVNMPGRGGEDDRNLVVAFAENQRGELRTSSIMPQLSTGGGKPGVGYPAVFSIQERAVSENPNSGPQGRDFQEDIAYTLEDRHHVQSVAYSIQDSREIEKRQNGLGISEAVAYTLDGTGAQGVAHVPSVVGTLSDGAHHGGGLNGQDAYSGRVLAPRGVVRRLTPKECERLQGFPDDHTSNQSDAQRYKQIGNAVALPVAEWIGRRIQRVNG